ncbi:MAG TPA: class I SAM-dependent methyltransferase [Capsulimonadaceae bacterium]|jgi:predicted O-methyltransferase YrrM
MEDRFFKKFLQVSNRVANEGLRETWPIPNTANKGRGDLGLLPEDQCIAAWQVPLSSAQLLRFLVLLQRPKIVLELGASLGFSTLWLALGAKEVGSHVYTTEIFSAKAALARKNFSDAGVADLITLYENDILKVLEDWNEDIPLDFVFMDADKQRYGSYFDLIFPLMSDGALLVVDNVGNYPQYMTDFLTKVNAIKDSASHQIGIDNGLLLFTKHNGTNLKQWV